MRDFNQLKVWQKAHGLVLELYRVARTFPSEQHATTAEPSGCRANLGVQ